MPTLDYVNDACPLAPHIMLDWIGAPYKAKKKVQYDADELMAVNPAGAVPTLREDGLHTQAEAHRWSSFFTSEAHASFWPIFMPARYTVDTDEKARQPVIKAGGKLASKQFRILDRYLEGRSHILDGGRSVIDAYSFSMIRWARMLLPSGLTDFRNVQRLYDRIEADLAVQKVLAEEAAK